jgi:hypothetical protein
LQLFPGLPDRAYFVGAVVEFTLIIPALLLAQPFFALSCARLFRKER